jgi:hypothetical protein
MKLGGPPDRFRRVEAEAVRLDDAGVGLDLAKIDGSARRQVEQPARCGRSALDGDVWALPRERVDDFDVPRRVTEAVAGSVEDNRQNLEYRIQNTECRRTMRKPECGRGRTFE